MRDDPANSNVPYDWELNGHPAYLIRDWHPLPVLDSDVGPQLRRTLLEAVREVAPRLATMGLEAIAQAHALGHPAWVEDRTTGRILRLDPDGTRHFDDHAARLGQPMDGISPASAPST